MPQADLIIYTSHLRLRMKLRSIPQELPKQVYLNAKERYLDVMTGHHVAIWGVEINNKLREMALSYDERNKIVELITIHPIKTVQKLARLRNGRWRKI